MLKTLEGLATASSESKELFAWHLCHYIWLVRAGYTADYLNADESWQKIMPIAQRIQRDFHSWVELGQDYMVIHDKRFKQDPNQLGAYQFIYNLLISKTEPNSPWNLNPWDTRLADPPR